MLQVCLNGARSRAECSHLPVTGDELAAAAREAVAAGAEDIHLHPKDGDGRDTLEAVAVAAAVSAVRATVPGPRGGHHWRLGHGGPSGPCRAGPSLDHAARPRFRQLA
ncbi:3-keto-5-aminohexanoate cleavage protein [Streptomyces ureilyticus]|uniref:3-keto-5-aminohexanoate cleavage protein n=1 Tax=Streptomyces ureilyticus TaxID=1775131 RepID=UPI001F34C577|nr:3-keto-5-aminohexanoate cleavage protein [Streptomyces ureilyticus]